MTMWTALIPLKAAGFRKSRLRSRLQSQTRERLSEALARHVAEVLLACPGIGRVVLLGGHPLDPRLQWLPDHGRGLNAELAAAESRLGNTPLLILPADLPWLDVPDVDAMLEAGSIGSAIAPDRHGVGTNGLALAAPRAFPFAFGQGSFDRHLGSAGPAMAIVRRVGLAFDIDTPHDLDVALASGFSLPDSLPQRSDPA